MLAPAQVLKELHRLRRFAKELEEQIQRLPQQQKAQENKVNRLDEGLKNHHESIKKTNRAVVIEEDWRSYGIGAEVAATIQEEAFDYLDAPVQRVAGVEVPLPYAAKLSQASKPGAQDLKNAIARALEGGKRWQK